ncbi:GspE/PulE family protein [Marinomonas sp.]
MTLEQILSNAISSQATDIHIAHMNDLTYISQRIYGQLEAVEQQKRDCQLVNRIKMRANLDLSETRRSQEGQFLYEDHNCHCFVRVSIIPTIKGEKVALRLLPDKQRRNLAELGFTKPLLNSLETTLGLAHGLILVCGATGAGKSTTLYACLDKLNTGKRSIFTIEDPVEYEIPGLIQCEPNDAIEMSSLNLLKSFLRQDPDVIMVGEIRDALTANLAVGAALTGHLVLATLHTNSPLDAIHRCRGWNVDFFSLVSSLHLIIHQTMYYKSTFASAIFSAIEPNWNDTLPKSYEELIDQPSLWNGY